MDPSGTGTLTPEELLELYSIGPEDLEQIRKLGARIVPGIDRYVARFYDWLETRPEFSDLFTDPETLVRVRAAQSVYWTEFFEARVDPSYVSKRSRVGELHARIGLSLPTYFASMNLCMDMFAEKVDGDADAATALSRMLHLDTAIVVESFSRLTSRTIAEQSRSLIAMSTPITAIWRDILLLPLVGVIDSQRAQDLTSSMLQRISDTNARVIIVDIGGVAVVDTAVANHLIKITKATRLMGCECTISGLSPAIAQTIVELGIEVGAIQTTSTLKDALEKAFEKIGVQIRADA